MTAKTPATPELHVQDMDNRATMHRGRPFDDVKYRRELRRVTTLDVEEPPAAASGP